MKQVLFVINITDLKAFIKGDGYAFGISLLKIKYALPLFFSFYNRHPFTDSKSL